MICPKCGKAEIKEQISISGIFTKKKMIIFYCPACKFENKKEFKISKEDMEIEKMERLNKPHEIIHKILTMNNKANKIITVTKPDEYEDDD